MHAGCCPWRVDMTDPDRVILIYSPSIIDHLYPRYRRNHLQRIVSSDYHASRRNFFDRKRRHRSLSKRSIGFEARTAESGSYPTDEHSRPLGTGKGEAWLKGGTHLGHVLGFMDNYKGLVYFHFRYIFLKTILSLRSLSFIDYILGFRVTPAP